MIPKIIHYSWFSGDPYPEPVSLYMKTWKRVLPDYEFLLWDRERAREVEERYLFVKEALQERKWAFAADVVRLYAVHKYGGIWLDIDVEMRKPFDPLLHHRMFIGKEYNAEMQDDWANKHIHTLTSHCFGAEAGHPFLSRCLEYYSDRHFILSHNRSLPDRLRLDLRILPAIQASLAYYEFGYDGGILGEDDTDEIKEGIVVYPAWCFEQPKYHPMEDAYCIHHFFGAWHQETSGHEYEGKGLYKAPAKDLKYYLFTALNKYLKKRGYLLKVISFGR